MVLAVISARGGSKGIPRKNVRLMNGKPLIYYAIHNAKNCPSIDDVVVSSDDEEILKIASSYGAETMTRDSVSIPMQKCILFGNSEHPFPEKQSMPFRSRVQLMISTQVESLFHVM